jgi:hypothetical protein
MVNHKKPTKEELDAKIKESIEELDKPEVSSPSKEVPPEIPPETPPEISPSPSEEAPSPSPSEEVPPETPSVTPPEKKKPDYKEKFKQSSREAQVITAKNKSITKAIDEAANVIEPTDDEMKAIYKDRWEFMSDIEKELAKDNVVSKRKFDILHKSVKEGKDFEAWSEQVEVYTSDPKTLIKFPDLDGKEEEFKIFALKPTRRGVPLEDLVAAFLFDATKILPKKKGKMFEQGSGGSHEKEKIKGNKVSVEEATRIRDTDYKRYKFLLKNNLIDESTIQ